MTEAGAIVPLLFLGVIIAGLCRGTDVYAAFAEGAADGLPVLLRLLPYLASMLVAVRLLTDSGVFSLLSGALSPLCGAVGLDAEVVPLILIRPFSGSGAMAVLRELFASCGADSRAAFTGSVLMGSSETIFYEVAIYFGAVGVKKTRFAVPVALTAAAASLLVSVLLTRAFYR